MKKTATPTADTQTYPAICPVCAARNVSKATVGEYEFLTCHINPKTHVGCGWHTPLHSGRNPERVEAFRAANAVTEETQTK